jgi:hypothetical protein
VKEQFTFEKCLYCGNVLDYVVGPINFWMVKRCERCKRYWLYNTITGKYKTWKDQRRKQTPDSWKDSLDDFTWLEVFKEKKPVLVRYAARS